VSWLSDATVAHLRTVGNGPDLSGTKYSVVGQLARGGMGTVYVAVDRDLDREVAIKVVNVPEVAPDAAERLVQEARILARLEHPGIVPVHDVGTLTDGRVFYVMKLVRGRRLDEHVGPETPLSTRLRIFDRLCETVAFAHAHGVIHRDLKPDNIMVGPFGEVLVMDWGVAKLLAPTALPPAPASASPVGTGPAPHVTQAGTVLGTRGYMAPEQEQGQTAAVDHRADVFALGAILSCLAGSELPPPLRAICTKALEPDPGHRYQSVQDMADEVLRFESGWKVHAYPEGIIEKTRRLVRRYRVPLLLVLAYMVMRALLLWFGRG